MEYTIGFIFHGTRVLLLNREKKPHKGLWTGIGGKIDPQDSSPLNGMLREIEEEAGIKNAGSHVKIRSVGFMEWFREDPNGTLMSLDTKGMHIFVAEIGDDVCAEFLGDLPRRFNEGLLDWKELDWILDADNVGIAPNVKPIFAHFADATGDSYYVARFRGDKPSVDYYASKNEAPI